ncbi:hypothetical protein J6590_032437 [Homalodisca vitripennis]|nr:hypothetical protein J6590_032437 [Homalodisca vitripennis]
MPHLKKKPRKLKPLIYEMTKRKENWRALNDPLEHPLKLPMELQAELVKEVVDEVSYQHLALILGFPVPEIPGSEEQSATSVDTIIPFRRPRKFVPETVDGLKLSVRSSGTADSELSPHDGASKTPSLLSYETETEFSYEQSETQTSSEESSEAQSEFVEVEVDL